MVGLWIFHKRFWIWRSDIGVIFWLLHFYILQQKKVRIKEFERKILEYHNLSGYKKIF